MTFHAQGREEWLGAHRRSLLGAASGDVLEIGAGTGANLPFYGGACRPSRSPSRNSRWPAGWRSAAGASPSRTRSCCAPRPRTCRSTTRVRRGRLDTRALHRRGPAACAAGSAARTAAGRETVVLEHVRSDDAKVARWQDRLLPFNVRLMHGCHCNRPTLDGIRAAGFEITQVDHGTIPHAPPFDAPVDRWRRRAACGVAEGRNARLNPDDAVRRLAGCGLTGASPAHDEVVPRCL